MKRKTKQVRAKKPINTKNVGEVEQSPYNEKNRIADHVAVEILHHFKGEIPVQMCKEIADKIAEVILQDE